MQDIKCSACGKIDSARDELIGLSHAIHDDPELSGQEFRAAERLCKILSEHGFEITHGYGGEKTGFRARISSKYHSCGPVVAFIAEYDALAGLGHGCGHNIICSCAVGAAIGISKVIDNIDGEVWVIGTPDEEVDGGKIRMLKAGAFDGVDYVLELHPSNKNMINRGHVACTDFIAEFTGKAAHSSLPSAGINALSALIMLFNMVDMHRQTWPTKWIPRINGIITDGGKASNVITPYAAGKFLIRTKHVDELMSILGDMEELAKTAASSIGAEVNIHHTQVFMDTIQNTVMGFKFAENMKKLGIEMKLPDPDERMGSSDFGNVSHAVPGIHEYLNIIEPCDTAGTHTEKFAEAAVSETGDSVVLLGAKGMAMTACDIFTDSSLRQEAMAEFNEKASIVEA